MFPASFGLALNLDGALCSVETSEIICRASVG